MRTYIAAAFESRDRLYPWVEKLRQLKHEIVSSWLDERSDVTYDQITEAYRQACGVIDSGELKTATLFILDTGDVNARGGREVEFGQALAFGIPTILIGPLRNVFHRLAWKHFNDWEDAIKFLQKLHRD